MLGLKFLELFCALLCAVLGFLYAKNYHGLMYQSQSFSIQWIVQGMEFLLPAEVSRIPSFTLKFKNSINECFLC